MAQRLACALGNIGPHWAGWPSAARRRQWQPHRASGATDMTESATAALPVSIEELRDLVAQAPFLQPFGFVVQSCAPGECVLRVPFAPMLERPGGVVSGITIMAGADVAMWLAIMTRRGSSEHWVTTDLKTAFLRGARQENLFFTARIRRLGQRMAYGDVDCVGEASGLVAHHVVTYARART